MGLAFELHPAPWEEAERRRVEDELAYLVYPATTRYHAARDYRRCASGLAPWCTGIHAGERYALIAFPPGSYPFQNKHWLRVAECSACAEWCGRQIPRTGESTATGPL